MCCLHPHALLSSPSAQIALADRNLEAAEMRQSLGQAWSAADPNIIQLKQLLLDPAVSAVCAARTMHRLTQLLTLRVCVCVCL